MTTIIQINVTANWGSHGKIAEDIGKLVIDRGWRSIIAYGRYSNPSKSEVVRIGNDNSIRWHALESRLFDNHGRSSRIATRKFIREIESVQPDLIHLHNIHGYFLNYQILFDYLSHKNIPIVWTLHDCWPFTGHCAYFDYVGCGRWKYGCKPPCPGLKEYPKSILFDSSSKNYTQKKQIFNSVNNLTIVPVSQWLADLVAQSFLNKYPIHVIKNGIDINTFCPLGSEDVRHKYNIGDNRYVLGVASIWERRKGFDDFIKIVHKIPNNIKVVLVGLDKEQLEIAKNNGIIGIPRTENVKELVALYSGADIFLNLTYEDNYPTTNLEAIACGTPVLTYNTGGSPESIDPNSGWVINKGGIDDVVDIIKSSQRKSERTIDLCVNRAKECFDNNKCFSEYIQLYDRLLKR